MSYSTLSVSVIIPTYNGRQLLAKHLPGVIAAVGDAEIVVVDDASTDDTDVWLRATYPQIKIVKHESNRRFAVACNSGVAVARGEVVVLLNNDVEPEPDFLPPLLSPFANPAVFAVGCKEISQEGTAMVEQGRAGGAFRRGFIVHWRCADQNRPTTLWAFGGSGIFRKSMWDELGGMDPLFYPAYEEDRDLCYRALKRGWQVRFAPTSTVHHQHESTNIKALGKRTMVVASYKNQFLLVWKNVTDIPYLLQHLFWLPYHLVFTNLRSGGAFGAGFVQACSLLPAVIAKRRQLRKFSVKADAVILRATTEE